MGRAARTSVGVGVEATLYCHLQFIPSSLPMPTRSSISHSVGRTVGAPISHQDTPCDEAVTRMKKGHVKRKYSMRINASLFNGVIWFIITKNLIKAIPLLWKYSSKPSPLDATSTWMAAQWPSCKAMLQPLHQSNCLKLQACAHLCPALNVSPSLTVYALSCVPWLPIKQQQQ